jgi:MFS family permease
MLGMGLVGVGLNLYVVPAALVGLVVATLLWSFGETIGSPAVSAYPGQIAPPELRGRYMAAAAAAGQLGYAVGPVLGAAVWVLWHSGLWWLCGLLTVGAVACIRAGIRQTANRDEASSESTVPAGAGEGRSE